MRPGSYLARDSTASIVISEFVPPVVFEDILAMNPESCSMHK